MIEGRRLGDALLRRVRLRRNLGTRRRHPYRWPSFPRGEDRSEHEAWLVETRGRWREWAADAPDDGDEITVVCATRRPTHLHRVVENFDRQRYRSKRLVVVPNSAPFDGAQLRWLQQRDVTLLPVGNAMTLGECLNVGLGAARGALVAKFDDDDEYGPDYLSHLRFALSETGAAVAGKHTTFGFVSSADETVLRFPGHEMEYTLTVAGGTLLIDLDRCDGVRFPPVGVGEDGGLLREVERRGGLVFSADRFNYLQHRTGDNTWDLSDERYRSGSVVIGAGCRRDLAFDVTRPVI